MKKSLFQFSIPYWPHKRLFVDAYINDFGVDSKVMSITIWSGRRYNRVGSPRIVNHIPFIKTRRFVYEKSDSASRRW